MASQGLRNVFKLRDVVNVKDPSFGAKLDGVTDDSAAFAAAYASLGDGGGLVWIPPGTAKLDFTGADVVTNPIVTVTIEKDNVFIEGAGDATVLNMTGITAAQLNAGSNDPSASGVDAATVFNFSGVEGGGVANLRITGTGGGTAITVGKARAKGVGVFNSQRIQIRNVTGKDIPGNLINLRGNSGAEATSTSYCSVEHCAADSCSENGINFMGGTYRCSLIGSQSHNNQYHGFESGTANLVCMGNSCKGNAKYGVAHVGDGGLIADNVLESNTNGGVNLSWNSASFPGNAIVRGNAIKNTGAVAAGVTVTGRASGAPSGFKIDGNDIETAYYGVIINTGSHTVGIFDFTIVGNTIKNTGTTNFPILISPRSGRFLVSGNYCEGGSTGLRVNNRTATISTIERATNVVTVVTTAAHGFTSGDRCSISGTTDTQYHGFHDITSTPTATSFTFALTGADDSGDTGGTANALECSGFSILGNRFYNQSADCVILQGYKFEFKGNTCVPASGATRTGQVLFADKMTLAGNTFQDQNFSISSSITGFASPPLWNIYDNTGDGAPLKGSGTFAPGALADGAGATSNSFSVTAAELGDAVEVYPPYSLQGFLCTAYVDAANSVRIRVQNETGAGPTDLGSGTWKVKVIKKRWT